MTAEWNLMTRSVKNIVCATVMSTNDFIELLPVVQDERIDLSIRRLVNNALILRDRLDLEHD